MILEMCKGSVLTAFEESVRRSQVEARELLADDARNNEPARDVAAGETEAEYQQRRAEAYLNVIEGALPEATPAFVAKGLQAAISSAIPYKALERQKRFMRRKMRKPADMAIRKYVGHITRLNDEELPFLPPFDPAQNLSEDEILDIITFGIPKSWEKEMNKQDFDPFRPGTTLRQLVEFCERIEHTEDSTLVKNNSNKKAKTQSSSKNKTSKPEGKYCEYHESTTHDTSECTVLKKLKASKKDKPKTWDKKSSDAKKFTKKELNALVKKASDKAYKKGKKDSSPAKRKKDDSDDDKSEASLNNIEALESQMRDVDQQLSRFKFDGKEIDV
jgi:hypothetical protein